ncbi:MAG TPA: adenosylcobinamide-GDP ribazoletransferase [Aquabacterium sp.]|nr:adenosylcobinamide-GDP ribazoletransferase [Aquabacterium sp.]
MKRIIQGVLYELRLFFTALQFFTRVPVPAWVGFEPDWLHHCVRYFPIVGALVGLWGACVLACSSLFWPPAVAVLLSMAATVWMTGGFHEDGWADTCDGLGGTVSKARALEIMKDSRLGSYGGLGLILILMLKAIVLTMILAPVLSEMSESETSRVHQVLLGWTAMAVVWAHSVSRLAPVVLTAVLPYGGDSEHAKAKPLAMRVGAVQLLVAILLTVAVASLLLALLTWAGWPVPTLWRCLVWSSVGAALTTAFCFRWFASRLGGFTGDTLGASQQMAEVAALLGWLAVVHPVTWVHW